MEAEQSRRRFLQATLALGAVGLAGGGPGRMSEPEKQKKDPAGKAGKAEEEVSPAEDLMREHGVLKRVLLVYGESLRGWIPGKSCLPRRWRTRPESSGHSSRTTTRSSRRIFSFRASVRPTPWWTWSRCCWRSTARAGG
jgi:hypothetical protein